MSSKTIKLGEKYQDEITGFAGIATGRYEYLNGCVRYSLEAPGKDGKPEEFIFDEQRLVAVDGSKPKETATAGGPRTQPARNTSRQ